MEYSQSETDTAQRLFELTTLYEVSRLLQLSDSFEQTAFDVLTSVVGLTGARWGIFWKFEAEERSLGPLHACGLSLTHSGALDLPDDWIADLSARSEPLLLNQGRQGVDYSTHPEGRELPAWTAGYEPELILPLSASGKLYGIIGLGSNFLDHRYEPFLQDLLGSVGYLAGLALSRQSGFSMSGNDCHSQSVTGLRSRYPELGRIIGSGPAVRELYRQICTVAHASCTVLLEGETGTGKQLVAEVIHQIGQRRDGPFIELDCGSVPEGLIESELFGHLKGSFTGAHSNRGGVFELASGGTLFLDEVGNLPMTVQGRLLRVLQERRFRPVGGERNIEVDVRVIAATNRNLQVAVREGTFREDLFYRLYVYPVMIPPLRDRKNDISALVSHFINQCAEENSLSALEFTDEFLQCLQKYDFPGNIRELRHAVERVMLQANGQRILGVDSLRDILIDMPSPLGIDQESNRYERPPKAPVATNTTRPEMSWRPHQSRGEWVVEVLKDHRFNIRSAADSLAIFANSGVMDVPPLTDRSSLTYYLQGECFRLYLENDGDLDQVGCALCPDNAELRRIAVLKAQRYLASAREVLLSCTDRSEAESLLLSRFSKLPGRYRTVLTKLAAMLCETKDCYNSSRR
ncbi:sigma 54-interacting transcriptional regulator [Gemmatimonadota bacterium]